MGICEDQLVSLMKAHSKEDLAVWKKMLNAKC